MSPLSSVCPVHKIQCKGDVSRLHPDGGDAASFTFIDSALILYEVNPESTGNGIGCHCEPPGPDTDHCTEPAGTVLTWSAS